MRILLAACILFTSVLSAHATVYWASPSGSATPTCSAIDSVGTSAAPGTDPGSYGSILGAAKCATVAGDIVNIKAGTYTSANNRIDTTGGTNCPSTCLKSGTSGAITYLQGDPGGAVPQLNIPNWITIYNDADANQRSYVTIKNVIVNGNGESDPGGATIFISGDHLTVDNVEIYNSYNMAISAIRSAARPTANHHMNFTNNRLHAIAGGGGSTGDGNGYCFYINADDVLVERNLCYDARGGGFQIYDTIAGQKSDRPIIRYNYIHDITRATQTNVLNECFGIAVDGATAKIYNNIIDGAGCISPGYKSGIQSGYEAGNSLLAYNNIIINWNDWGIQYGLFAQTTGNEIKNNIILGNLSGTYSNTSNNGSTVTATTNKTTGSLTDCTVSTSNFTQKSTSTCINAGTNIGFPYNDSAPDIEVFEKMTFASCSVENGDASNLRVTFNNSAFPPLSPATAASITGFTARQAGVNDPLTNGTRVGTNRADFPMSIPVVAGAAVDVSVSSTNLTDTALIAGTLNQPLVQTLTNQSCTNNVSVGSTDVLTQAKFRFHALRGTEASPLGTPYASAPVNTNIYVVPGGSVRLRFGITCTVADCPPTGFIPRYSLNGGAYTVVPDTFSTDRVAFCGTSPDPDIPNSGAATTQQLSLSGTFAPGGFVRTSNAIPTIDMVLNGNTEVEYCFAWNATATVTDIYQFRIYQQDGTPLDGFTVTPKATITPVAHGSGF